MSETQPKTNKKTKTIPIEEYRNLKSFYDKQQRNYTGTLFFKRRGLFLIGCVVLLFLSFPFIEPTETEITLFSSILSLSFLAIIVIIDEIILGLVIFGKEDYIQ